MQEDTKYYTVDASFILAFLLPDEQSDEVLKIFRAYEARKVHFISSTILPLEVVNGLKYATGKRISKREAIRLIHDFLSLSINLFELDLEELLNLSLDKNLSVYDASYLYLAKSQKALLLTLDKALQKLA